MECTDDIKSPIQYIISIDQGSSSTKAIIYYNNLEIKSYSAEVFTKYDNDSVTVNFPHLVEGIIFILYNIAIDIGTILPKGSSCIGISFTNQRETVCIVDPHTYKPIKDGVSWQDQRSISYCDELLVNNKISEDSFYSDTGLVLSPYLVGPKILQLRKENSEIDKHIENTKSTCILTVDAYITATLTSAGPITDVTNASRYGMMDLNTLSWNESLCNQFGISSHLLPKIVHSSLCDEDVFLSGEVMRKYLSDSSVSQYLDKVCEVFDHIPILSILSDQAAAGISHELFEPQRFKITMGTGTFTMYSTDKIWDYSSGEKKESINLYTSEEHQVDWSDEIVGIYLEILIGYYKQNVK